jgi:hypothetical protein
MNVPFSSIPTNFAAPGSVRFPATRSMVNPDDEETRRRRVNTPLPPATIYPTQLAQDSSDTWGANNTCTGLKILCGVFGAIVLALVIVLIVKMSRGDAQSASRSPGQSQLPMSLAGGFDPMGESLMSTGE